MFCFINGSSNLGCPSLKCSSYTVDSALMCVFKDIFLIRLFFFFLYHAALPQWVRMINDTQMDSGEKLQWECKAIGRPRPTYRWLRNGLPLTSQVPSIHRPSSSLIAQFMQHYHVKYAHFRKHCFLVSGSSWNREWGTDHSQGAADGLGNVPVCCRKQIRHCLLQRWAEDFR